MHVLVCRCCQQYGILAYYELILEPRSDFEAQDK